MAQPVRQFVIVQAARSRHRHPFLTNSSVVSLVYMFSPSDLKDMPDIYNDRLAATKKLESAETTMIKTAAKLKRKDEKAAKKKNGATLDDKWTSSGGGESDVSIAERLVPKKKRPSHRLKPFSWLPFGLPFMGKKVDTIDWCREQIVEKGAALHSAREQLRKDIATPGVSDDEFYPPLNSAFVLFNQQIAAHMALQSLIHNQPYAMAGRYIEMAPRDVIWSNLSLNPYVSLPLLALLERSVWWLTSALSLIVDTSSKSDELSATPLRLVSSFFGRSLSPLVSHPVSPH